MCIRNKSPPSFVCILLGCSPRVASVGWSFPSEHDRVLTLRPLSVRGSVDRGHLSSWIFQSRPRDAGKVIKARYLHYDEKAPRAPTKRCGR